MKKGFTLIELLVVIFIIGSLSALLVPNFMAARENARDARRKSDLKEIQNALELYKQDYPQYPSAVQWASVIAVPGHCWANGTCTSGNIYIKSFPGDPLDNSSYQYATSATQTDYVIGGCLENAADPDRNASIPCTGNIAGVNYNFAPGCTFNSPPKCYVLSNL